MRLIFVNRFYWPEEPATSQLLADLAPALAEAGHQVRVVTSRHAALARRETRAGVGICRVGPARGQGRSLFVRALDFACFSSAALLHLARHTRRGDTVILLTDPPLLGLLATPLLRLRRARIVHWLQDIYPEVAIELSGRGWLRGLLCGLRPLRNAAWRRAAACVTLGPDMATTLNAARVAASRSHIIPNWPLPELSEAPLADIAALKTTWPDALTDKFIVLYSGNLGRVHDLPPILEVAAALRDTAPHIAIVFVGRGAQQAPLRTAAHERALTNIHFLPPAPRARLSASLSAGDLHLVTLKPGCERYVLPSKLYGIAAVARPLLFIGSRTCALFKEVTQTGIGLSFARDETSAAANAIRTLADSPEQRRRMQAAARQFSQTHTFATSLNAWRKLLDQSESSQSPSHSPPPPKPRRRDNDSPQH